jgi:head-tail adaptor
MWLRKYYPGRYFAPRYFPGAGAVVDASAGLRAGILARLLDQTVDVQRPAHLTDADGSPIADWTDAISSLRCRITELSGRERGEMLARDGREITHVLDCNGDRSRTIPADGRVVWGDRYLAITAPARAVKGPGYVHHTEVDLREVTG